jgi:hypothetical protein
LSPEGLAATSAAVEALTARLAAAHAGAAPWVTAAVDPVSLQTAAGFSVHGSEHAVMAAQGIEELGRSGVGVGESGVSYFSGDAAAAATYLIPGGRG